MVALWLDVQRITKSSADLTIAPFPLPMARNEFTPSYPSTFPPSLHRTPHPPPPARLFLKFPSSIFPKSHLSYPHSHSMDISRTAYGTWSGGRFMHFGEAITEERFINAIRHAYHQGIRTFMTADVYGNGAADSLLGRALSGLPRDSYALVGMIGHDFTSGQRDGSKGFPRFTHPPLLRRLRQLHPPSHRSLARPLPGRPLRLPDAPQPRRHRLHQRCRLERHG